jgi:hypothetical protein
MTTTTDLANALEVLPAPRLVGPTLEHDTCYGFVRTTAIIDHTRCGRILIEDGYGGEDSIAGGAVRWRHGWAAQLLPEDTMDTLLALHPDIGGGEFRTLDLIRYGRDPNRPIKTWHGRTIEAIAHAVGLP